MAWNRPSEEKKVEVEKRGGQRNVHLKGLVAGAIVVVGAAVAAWLLWPDAKRPLSTSTSTSTSLIRAVKPAKAPKTVEAPRPREVGKPKREQQGWGKDGYFHYRTTSGLEMKTTNIYLIASMTSQTPGVQNPWLKRDESKPRRYNSVLQNELAGFMTPGKEVCLSCEYTDEEALKMAKETINYGFDEPLETLEEKKAVEDACKDLVKYIEEGGHAQDYFNELLHRQQMEHTAVSEARKEVLRICREEGDIEGAKAALSKFNEYLEGKGLRPLNMESSMEVWVRLGKLERGEIQ